MKEYLDKIKKWYMAATAKELSYDKKSIQPDRDWQVIFLTTFTAIILLGLCAFYFYTKVNNGDFFQATGTETQIEETINTTLLKKTVEDINSRALILVNVRQNKNIPPDPSL